MGLDYGELLARVSDDVPVVGELLEAFQTDLPKLEAAFAQALEAADAERLRALAHRLKGSAQVFSAHRLRARAEWAEMMWSSGQLDEALHLVHELVDLSRMLVVEIEQALNEGSVT